MRVLFQPQFNPGASVAYTFDGERVSATLDGASDVFDFSVLPEGATLTRVTTELPVNPVISAHRTDGVVEVVLLRWYDDESAEGDLWPQWEEV